MNAVLNTTRFAGFIAALFAAEAGFAQTSLSIGTVPGSPGATNVFLFSPIVSYGNQ
jgi:hypothetical protein